MSLTASRIISIDDLRAAVEAIPHTLPKWQGEEGPRLELTIAPGMVRLSRRDRGLAERALDRRWGERAHEVRALRDSGLYPGGMTGAKREGITTFTRQARARMVRTLTTLDYAPLFVEDSRPAMVTLTLPGDWEKIAPSAAEFKKIVNRFKTHYRRAWGVPIVGVWKLEFQKRGAPHLHILMTVPSGRARGGGQEWREWLALAWAGACSTAELLGDKAAEQHIAAGTGTHYSAANWGDAKRIAVYYAKHGLYSDKEYQNQAPDLWVSAGSVGRFWGYWGLKKGGQTLDIDMRVIRHDPSPEERLNEVVAKCQTAGIPVSMNLLNFAKSRLSADIPHEYAPLSSYIERYLRRRAKQQSYFQRVPVTRYKINARTGEIKEYIRHVKKRRQFYTGGSGFLVVNNGLAAAKDIELIVKWWISVTGHQVDDFTMYDELHQAHEHAETAR